MATASAADPSAAVKRASTCDCGSGQAMRVIASGPRGERLRRVLGAAAETVASRVAGDAAAVPEADPGLDRHRDPGEVAQPPARTGEVAEALAAAPLAGVAPLGRVDAARPADHCTVADAAPAPPGRGGALGLVRRPPPRAGEPAAAAEIDEPVRRGGGGSDAGMAGSGPRPDRQSLPGGETRDAVEIGSVGGRAGRPGGEGGEKRQQRGGSGHGKAPVGGCPPGPWHGWARVSALRRLPRACGRRIVRAMPAAPSSPVPSRSPSPGRGAGP